MRYVDNLGKYTNNFIIYGLNRDSFEIHICRVEVHGELVFFKNRTLSKKISNMPVDYLKRIENSVKRVVERRLEKYDINLIEMNDEDWIDVMLEHAKSLYGKDIKIIYKRHEPTKINEKNLIYH